MKKILPLILLIVLLFINADSEKNIVIAFQKSDFKDNVLKQVNDYYKNKPVKITTIDISKIKEIDINNINGLIIFVSVQKNLIDAKAAEFIKNNASYKNLFLILTSDSGKWDKKEFEIDTFTSASKKGNEKQYTDKIISIIDGIAK